MTIVSKLFDIGRAQFLGILAQILAAAPILLMSIFLAREVSLSALADFTILVGVSAFGFSLALLNLRSRLLIDRFNEFEAGEYLWLRIYATGIMLLVIITAWLILATPLALTIAIILMRVGDAGLDLVLGFDQVERDESSHLLGYLFGSTAKLVLVSCSIAAAVLTPGLAPEMSFLAACAIYSVIAWSMLSTRIDVASLLKFPAARRLFLLIKATLAFSIAQLVSAGLTTSPRLALSFAEDQEMAGAAAASLSVSTFVGMAFFAVWLRWGPRLGKSGLNAKAVILVFMELLLVCALLLTAFFLAANMIMEWVFEITLPLQLQTASDTIMASVVFFFVMTSANIFKFTRTPLFEALVYLGGVVAVGFALITDPIQPIPNILAAGSAGMAIALISAMVILSLQSRTNHG